MHGNVAEWVIDQHSPSYKKFPKTVYMTADVEMRLEERRGKLGLVDERLMEAVKRLEDDDKK